MTHVAGQFSWSWLDILKRTPLSDLLAEMPPLVHGVVYSLGEGMYVDARDGEIVTFIWCRTRSMAETVAHLEPQPDQPGEERADPPPPGVLGFDDLTYAGVVAHANRHGYRYWQTSPFSIHTGRIIYGQIEMDENGRRRYYFFRSAKPKPTDEVMAIKFALRRVDAPAQPASTPRPPLPPQTPDPGPSREWLEIVASLAQSGLWAALPADQQTRARAEAEQGNLPVTWPRGGIWFADGEDLSDGIIEDWIKELAPTLATLGVNATARTLERGTFDNARYEVEVCGEHLRLYGPRPDNPAMPDIDDPWLECTIAPATVINHQLTDARSPARLLLLEPGGNDGIAVIGDHAALTRSIDALSTLGIQATIPH